MQTFVHMTLRLNGDVGCGPLSLGTHSATLFFYLKLHSLHPHCATWSHRNPFTVCFSCCFLSNIFHLSLRLVWPVILFLAPFWSCLYLFFPILLLHCLLSPWLWPPLARITISLPSRSPFSLVSFCAYVCVCVSQGRFEVCRVWQKILLVTFEEACVLWLIAMELLLYHNPPAALGGLDTHTHTDMHLHT